MPLSCKISQGKDGALKSSFEEDDIFINIQIKIIELSTPPFLIKVNGNFNFSQI